MTLFNLAAILLLGRQAFLLLADYVAQKRQGIKIRSTRETGFLS